MLSPRRHLCNSYLTRVCCKYLYKTSFLYQTAYEPLGKQKAPKVLADAVTWINAALTEFGIAGLTLRSLIDFLKNVLGNSNAQVRTSATKTLVTVKMFAGPGTTYFYKAPSIVTQTLCRH